MLHCFQQAFDFHVAITDFKFLPLPSVLTAQAQNSCADAFPFPVLLVALSRT